MNNNNHNNNSFLHKAHESAKQTLISIIQSTFYQIATIILQSYIQEKITNQKNQCHHQQPQHDEQHDEQQQYHITQNDIDTVYKIINKIGLQWMKQLQVRNEYELSNVVKLVLNYGHFLEFYNNDNDHIECLYNNQNNNIHVQEILEQVEGEEDKEEEEEEDKEKNEDDHISSTHQSNIPYVSLLQMTNYNSHGHNNTNNEHYTKMRSRHQCNRWHSLPTITTTTTNNNNKNNNSLEYNGMNHIPKCTILPSNQLLKPSTKNLNQLYSTPFLSLKQHCKVVKCYHPSSSVLSKTQHNNNHDNHDKSISTTKYYNHNDIQKYIHIIDQMGWKNHTMFYYDWNTIHYASIRNNVRMHIQQQQKLPLQHNSDGDSTNGLHNSSITTILGNNSSSNSKKRYRNNDNSIVLVNSNDGNKDTKKRPDIERPRVASDLGSAQWTWDDIHTTFSCNDIDTLFEQMMHDDNNNNNKHDDKNNNVHDQNVHDRENISNKEEKTISSQQRCHSCTGSLKVIGNIHLWEQLKHDDNWNGPKDDIDDENIKMDNDDDEDEYNQQAQKRRKHAYSKAKRQRLYPNVELKRVENLSKLTSKVAFTENSNNYFMELDLGECMLSLCNDKNEMKSFCFRSLEIQLKDE